MSSINKVQVDGVVYNIAGSGGGGGGGAVDSVNGQIGDVILVADDIDYDNTASGLNGTTIQEALDDLASLVDEEIFVATYGTTTNAQIESALTDGKFVYCKMTDSSITYYIPLVRRSNSTTHYFCAMFKSSGVCKLEFALCSSNSWSVSETDMYTKPSGGIPSTDLASAVQTSLGKADTAVQPTTEVTVSSTGAVTQALDAGKIYHFTGALTSLTITLNATSGLAQYHFDFLSGSTAPTLTMPSSVTMPDSFAVEASKRYEVDVLNGYGAVISWANS